MKVNRFSSQGQLQDEVQLDGLPVFEADKGIAALKTAVIAFQANLRQGNACTKTRGEVSGTGKKPWRQKGTGRARHGSLRSPIWAGGGVVSGPRGMTDFSQKVNRRVKALAFARALFERAKDGSIGLIDAFELEAPKTRLMSDLLNRVFPDAKDVLVVDSLFTDNTILAARNLPYVYLMDAASLNAWDLVRANKILLTKEALQVVVGRLNKKD
jgi:large subunit ribosomal protein L4